MTTDSTATAQEREYPAHMLGDEPLKVRIRATYDRIRDAVAGDHALAAEKTLALEWCRANGSPHLEKAA